MILKNGKRIDGCTDTLPVGTIQPFLGLTPPLGYLVCQGQLVSKIEYPELYNICKSTFGVETETHFYLPDLRGKTIAGCDSNDSAMSTIGKLLGAKTHIHNIPDHYHWLPYIDIEGGGLAIMNTSLFNKTKNYQIAQPEDTNWGFAMDGGLSAIGAAGGQHGTSTVTNQQTNEISNFQPTMVMNWIVKAAMLIPEYFKVDNTLNSTSTSNALSAAQGKILNDSKLSLTGGTLTGNITLATTYPTLILRSGNLLYNTTPSTTEYPCVLWTDKNNTAMGRLEMIAANDGSRYMSLYAIIPGDTAVGSFLKVGWDAAGNPKSSIDGDFTVGKGMTITNSLRVGGSITIGSGFGKKYTFTKTIIPTTEWQNIGINGNALPSGLYLIHLTGIQNGDKTWQYDNQYAGVMSWYSGNTNSGDASDIVLHQTGHANNGELIYLRTQCSWSNTNGTQLQIKSSVNHGTASNIIITIVKIV